MISSELPQSHQIIYESSLWTPSNITKTFDWDAISVMQVTDQADLVAFVQEYFGLGKKLYFPQTSHVIY